MNSTDILNTINGTLDILAKKLGVAVDKIYPILLKQVQVDLIKTLIAIIISTIILIVSIKLVLWGIKWLKSDEYVSSGAAEIPALVFGSILLIISAVAIIIFICTCVQIIVNPDYYIFSQYIQPLISK